MAHQASVQKLISSSILFQWIHFYHQQLNQILCYSSRGNLEFDVWALGTNMPHITQGGDMSPRGRMSLICKAGQYVGLRLPA